MAKAVDFSEIYKGLKHLSKLKERKEILEMEQKSFLKYLASSSPRDTGEYHKSWKPKKPKKDEAVIETKQGFLYGILEFDGCKPHKIRVRKAKSLHWEKPPGTHHFAMEVQHPGFDPIPHTQPSLKKSQPEALKKSLNIIKKKHEWITNGS